MSVRESEFEMPLPGGGSVRGRRWATRLAGGLSWIEEEMEVHGRLSGPFATGPGWIVERHLVTAGTVAYVQDGLRVPIRSRSFVLVYAPFAVTELVAEGLRTRWVGLAGESRAPADRPLLLEVPAGSSPRTPADMLALVTGRDARAFDRCTEPSRLSAAAKAVLDDAYSSSATVASLAARLGVSHAHLARCFKRDFGMAPMAYRQALRASAAAARLSRGERIIDVSGEVGYEDLGRFYKSFRRALRVPPGRCRIP